MEGFRVIAKKSGHIPLTWYQHRGLLAVSPERTMYEGVSYTAMELSAAAADRLLPPGKRV